jgi:hypothetical protein
VTNIVKSTTTIRAPGDQGFTTTKVVPAGQAVPAATYTLSCATRTSYSDQTSFSVNFILQNDHTNVDLSWDQMQIDMRGHTINNIWNATIVSTDPSTGVVTIAPMAGTKTVLAQSRNSFGFYAIRTSNVSTAHYQVLIKLIKW